MSRRTPLPPLLRAVGGVAIAWLVAGGLTALLVAGVGEGWVR